MAKSLQNILGFMPLTEALRATASGVPNPFPDEFFRVQAGNRILGDRASYIRITGERRTSKLAKYGSPARRRNLRDVSDQAVRMMHTFESFPVDMMVLQQLRAFERYQQDRGMDWLQYQVTEASKRYMNSRIISTASVLRFGAIYWDGDGNLLPTSSGAIETYDFGVPASHKNQCNGNISASWALANTDIPGDIRNLHQFALQETGLPLEACLYGKHLPRYLTQNDYVQAYLSRNPALGEKFLISGEIPSGLFGIREWRPVYTAFFEDQNGTNQAMWDDDLAVFIPALPQPDKMSWWALYEGSFPVPRSLEVQREAMAALSNFETVYGMFGYSSISINPPGIEVHSGDTWLPGLRSEKAPMMATVAF